MDLRIRHVSSSARVASRHLDKESLPLNVEMIYAILFEIYV